MNQVVSTGDDEKIVCQIDGARVHSVAAHIRANHPDWTIERYKEEYPDAPLLSKFAERLLEERRRAATTANAAEQKPVNAVGEYQPNYTVTKVPMHELFELGDSAAARSSTGKPIPVPVLSGHTAESMTYLVEPDNAYIWNIDLLKKVIVGLVLNKPIYLWGMHGTGKTTVLQQVAARMRFPVMRVQHTQTMEESNVLGQWVVRDGETKFQLGPLPTAMLNGWLYIADEYDVAMPGIVALYQPVLEGQPLVIKDAPPHLRRIVPHPEFRFAATGNTNGCGDETGLYQGTVMQNAANYSRFGVTEEVRYMDAAIEESILRSKVRLPAAVAEKIVKFAGDVRKQFEEGRISMTISPREMLAAAELGVAFGGDWTMGLKLAFANRLPRADKAVVEQYLQRIFG